MRALPILILAALPAPIVLRAQVEQHPYAGLETRTIKALSTDEIRGYLEGQGMGFAQAAELNHYPGPRHVLELADQLALTAAQRDTTHVLFERMNREARRLGRTLVEVEHQLDSVFAGGGADLKAVGALVERSAALRGQLRLRHLAAHLEMRHVLTPEQIMLYDRLRGYGGNTPHQGHHAAHEK